MSVAFIAQTLISLLAVAAIVGLAAWLGVPRVIGGMTEDQVRTILAEEHPGRPIDRVSVAPDGKSAIVLSGAQALIVKRVGDGRLVEVIPIDDLGLRRRASLPDGDGAPQTDVAA